MRRPAKQLTRRVIDLESARRLRDPSPLSWLTDAELDELEDLATLREGGELSPGALERTSAILEAGATRRASGAAPWDGSPAAAAVRELERRIYWEDLLPGALACGAPVDSDALHREARRIAGEFAVSDL